MKLFDFLRRETNVHELCAICEDGYQVATCWIGYEDLFIYLLFLQDWLTEKFNEIIADNKQK